MSNVVSKSDPLTSSEILAVENLAALGTSGVNQGIAKTGANTFANVTFSGGGGGSGFQQPTSGSLGQNTFTWSTAPNAIVADGAIYQKVQQDGGVVWTGTTTTILEFNPTSSIFAVA